MRLILRALARANLRWAVADLARAERLMREADAVQNAAEARLRLSYDLLARALARA